jgi:integrating conjugative element protein (TIGR03757 family)
MSKYCSLIVLSFIFTMAQARALTITIFTDTLHPIDIAGMNVTYYNINDVQQLVSQLNNRLTSLTRTQARLEAHTFLNQHRVELLNSTEGLARAQQLNITQFPAIVFDNKAVIYGQTKLTQALAEYQQWQKTVR